MIICSLQVFHSHAVSLLELDKVCFPTSHWYKAVWEGMFDNYDLRVVVSQRQSIDVGYVAFSRILEDSELLRIGVKPGFRQKGVAHILIEQTISLLRDEQVKRLFLEVRDDNLPALGLYRSFGFIEVGKRARYYKNPSGNALIFSLDL